MRRNMRFDGIPFRPGDRRRAEDKPRLVILADVSLSVRATARFTLHLVHGLQDMFGQVRSFAFVADLIEVTDLFADHPVEEALGADLRRRRARRRRQLRLRRRVRHSSSRTSGRR